MRKFRERNLIVIAAVTAVLAVLGAFIALDYSKLPLIGPDRTYSAQLQSAVGLQSGNVVTIAGVRVGQITGLSLDGTVAKVTFSVDKSYTLGSTTSLNVKVINPVGVEYLELVPSGPGKLKGTIPVGRTTVPGTLVGDLNTLTNETQQTNLKQLVNALEVVTQTLAANSPTQTKAAIDGVAALSGVLAGRQQELSELEGQADQLTGLLNGKSSQIVELLASSNMVLQVLQARKSAIDNLLSTTQQLATQIDGIISGDSAVITPMLKNLSEVSRFLAQDDTSISQALPLLAAFSRYSANLAGSGPYADFIAPTLVLPDNLIKECAGDKSISALLGCRA